ncbi:MAG: glycosyltransferase family 4 protein [Flavobacteriales bacterium]|nr:glycosyltransferase family 4 protein [Flavobacteriales bacterium]
MRILQVCLKPPYPKVDGGCIAMAAMTEGFILDGHSVKVLCMSTHKHKFSTSKVPSDILSQTEMEAVEIDTRIKPLNALLNLFSTKSYNVERFYSQEFENRLVGILKASKFDIIHLESVFCTPYLNAIRLHSNAKIVVRAHNIEFEIWEQLTVQENNPVKRWYLKLLASRLKKYELHVLKMVDGIVAITKDDASDLQNLGVSVPIEIIPIGVDVNSIPLTPLKSDNLNLYHLGAMDWQPNIDGINWFLDEVWPKVEAEFPNVSCSLAGRKMSPSLLSRSLGNLKIEGEISSVSGFISDKNVAIVPLLSGSGMRVKIVEALAFEKVVITTSIGATGIPYEDGKNILIANSPDEFVQKIRLLHDNLDLISSIGTEARKLAQEEFELKKLSSKLTYFYANL